MFGDHGCEQGLVYSSTPCRRPAPPASEVQLQPGCPRHLPEAGVTSQHAALEPGHTTGEVTGWRLSRLLQDGLHAAFEPTAAQAASSACPDAKAL